MQSPSPRFRSQQFFLRKLDMRRNILPKFIEIVWRHGALPDGLKHGGRKPTETSVAEFRCKSVNLSLEEPKNIKLILFLIHELFRQIAKFPDISHFFNQNDSSLGRRVNAAAHKGLEIQAKSITKPRTHSE